MSFSSESSFSTSPTRLIGIAGGTGSGKTVLAHALHHQLDPECAVLLHADHYYHDRSHLSIHTRETVNFDHPDACDTSLLIAHLHALVAGKSIDAPRYQLLIMPHLLPR